LQLPPLSDGVIKIFRLPTRCHGNEFWDKIDYNSASAKDNCTLFSPTSYFRARAMQWCHENSPLKTSVVMATNRFYSKTTLAAGSQERQTLKRSC